MHGLGASPPGVAGPAVEAPAVAAVALVAVAEGVFEEEVAPRSFDSGASEITFVTSREKNSSIV